MISCDAPPLFKHLKWDRDNDGRCNPDDLTTSQDLNKHDENYKKPQPIDTNPELLSTQKPNRNLSAYQINENEIAERFPNLINVPAEKLPQTISQKFESKADSKSLFRESFVGGSVVSEFSLSSAIGPANIVAELPNDRGSLKAQDASPNNGSKDHISVLDHLILANKAGIANVEFLVVTPETIAYENCNLNVMQLGIEHKDKSNSWIFLDENKNRRCAIIARIQVSIKNEQGETANKIRYLIEVQQKKSGEFSTIVLWSESEQIELGIFDGILDDMVEHKQVKVFNENIYQVEWGRLKHTTAFTGEIKDSDHFVKRIFDKNTEMNEVRPIVN